MVLMVMVTMMVVATVMMTILPDWTPLTSVNIN